nr:hypothetical protein [Tanacetum cinerariifolium]
MSTRSNSSHLFSPLRDPESLIRRRNLGEPSSLFDFEEVMNNNHNQESPPQNGLPPMVRPNGQAPRTMEELYQPSINGRGGPIAPIPIQATDFGLPVSGYTQETTYATTGNYNSGGTGSLPSNTVPTLQEDLKPITIHSGVTLAGPSVSPLSFSKEVDREPKMITDQVIENKGIYGIIVGYNFCGDEAEHAELVV